MKYIQYLVLLAVLVAFDWAALSGIGAPTVELHRREFLSNWFTGSILDWISFVVFNAVCIGYAIVLAKDKSVLWNEVGGNKWNYIFFGGLIGTVLLIYVG